MQRCAAIFIVLIVATNQLEAANANPADATRAERKLAREFAKGGQATDQARAALQKVIQAEMRKLTQKDQMARYETIRSGIYNEYLATYRAGAAEARKIVVQQVVYYGNAIAQNKKFSPASRINAIALLAELDDVPVVRSAPPSPAVGALTPLYQIANNDQAPLYLRSVALYGLERHIGRFFASWDKTKKRLVGSMLVRIVNSTPKSDLDRAAHAWMVRRAFDCLAVTGVNAVADNAIERLGNPDEMPSVRLTAAKYLSLMSSNGLSEEQKQAYLVSLAHFTRSQLVSWYEHEDDLLQRESGAGAGGAMGGYGGMDGGYGGEGMGMDMGGMGMGMGYGGEEGMYGGAYGAGTGSTKVKPIETQDWQTLIARRKVNQVSQMVHLCLNGRPVFEGKVPRKIGRPLSVGELPAELQAIVTDFVEKLESLQEAVNDAEAITDVNSLLQQAETPIEDIMDLVITIPGFAEKYPELAEDEGLEHVPDKPAEQPAEQPADGAAGAAAEQPGDNDGQPPAGPNGVQGGNRSGGNVPNGNSGNGNRANGGGQANPNGQ